MSDSSARETGREGFRHRRVQWTRTLETALLRIANTANPKRRGFLKRLLELWILEHQYPSTESALAANLFRLRQARKRAGLPDLPDSDGEEEPPPVVAGAWSVGPLDDGIVSAEEAGTREAEGDSTDPHQAQITFLKKALTSACLKGKRETYHRDRLPVIKGIQSEVLEVVHEALSIVAKELTLENL